MLIRRPLRWNLDLTKCQGTGDIVSFYQGFIISKTSISQIRGKTTKMFVISRYNYYLFFQWCKVFKNKQVNHLVPSRSPGDKGEVLGTRLEVSSANKRQSSKTPPKMIKRICTYCDSVCVCIDNELLL